MPSPQYEMFAAAVKAQRTDATPTLEELRTGFEMTGQMVPPPEDTAFEPVDAGGVPAEWVRAPGVGNERAILYLHGGGYAIGSAFTVRNFVARLSAAVGAPALSIDYRLGPEHPFPAAVEDAVTAYRWLLEQGFEPGQIAVSGESAGGGLTVALLVALRDGGLPLPACAVPISPWLDMELTQQPSREAIEGDLLTMEHLGLFAGWYLNGSDPRHPHANPLYADLTGLPPLLVMVGGHEVLLDDAKRLAERATAAGVDVTLEIAPEMIHIWHLFGPMFPEANEASDRAGAFIRSRT